MGVGVNLKFMKKPKFTTLFESESNDISEQMYTLHY